MELYYGDPTSFHLEGGIDSPSYTDHTNDLLNYFYRAILSFAFAAKAFGEIELLEKILAYSREFVITSGRENHLRDTKNLTNRLPLGGNRQKKECTSPLNRLRLWLCLGSILHT